MKRRLGGTDAGANPSPGAPRSTLDRHPDSELDVDDGVRPYTSSSRAIRSPS
jgi:hypothetical protein